MFWPVLPIIVPPARAVADVVPAIVNVIPIEVVVVIDVDVVITSAPVAITPPVVRDTCAKNKASAKG